MNMLEAKEIFDEYYLRLPWKLRSAIRFVMDNCEEFKDVDLEPPPYKFTVAEALNFLRDLTKLPTDARKEDTDFILRINCAVNALRNDLDIWRNPEDLPHEEWRDVENYEDVYQVSNYGRIKSFHSKNLLILKTSTTVNGYLTAGLFKNKIGKSIRINVVVARTFIDNPENKPMVNHQDSNPHNNCVWNLNWMTSRENQQHAVLFGNKRCGSKNLCSVLTPEQVRYIRDKYIPFDRELGANALSKKLGVATQTIIDAFNHKTYKDVI